ncbi:MAG: type II restriction endonuclease [Bacillota bacterium]|nr:type II restriction endonuclease [Bacillota bacterium]
MPNDTLEEFKRAIRRARKAHIPPPERVVDEAFHELSYGPDKLAPDYVRENFNTLLRDVFVKTLEVLERYEEPAYAEAAFQKLVSLRRQDIRSALSDSSALRTVTGLESAISSLLKGWYPYLRAMFISVSNSRKARGGLDLEWQFEKLLRLMAVPYQKQKGREGRRQRVDFVLPDFETYNRERNRALIISVKRTLRERYQQVADEQHRMRAPNVYIVTAEDRVSTDKVREIKDLNVYLVVWDEVKQRDYPFEPTVIGYTYLARDVIAEFDQRYWRQGQVEGYLPADGAAPTPTTTPGPP